MPSSESIIEAALDQAEGDPFVRAVLRTWTSGEREPSLQLLAEAGTDMMVRAIFDAEREGSLRTATLLLACAVELVAAELSADERRVAQARRWGQAHLQQLRRQRGDLAA